MLFSYLFKSSLLFLSPFCILAVLESINMKKGGPRTSLYDLCKRLQWPMPTFKTTEHKSRLVKDEAILINLIFYTFSGILNYNFQLLLVLSVSRIAYAYPIFINWLFIDELYIPKIYNPSMHYFYRFYQPPIHMGCIW